MTGILLVLVRNPGGKQTPQDSIHPTPHPKRIEDIEALLRFVTVRKSQSALRDIVCSDRPLATIDFNFALNYCRLGFETGTIAPSPVTHCSALGL